MSRGCTVCDHEQRERIDQVERQIPPQRRLAEVPALLYAGGTV